MASGASRQRATKMVAGVIRAAAVSPSPRRFSTTGPCVRAAASVTSDLERLVPPFLPRRVVLAHVAVVKIDQPLLLRLGKADALLQVGRHLGVRDSGVVPHVDGEAFLCR